MDLPEHVRVELAGELRERQANERLAVAGDDAGVLVGGLEVEHVVHRDLLDDLALQRANPTQPTDSAGNRAREPGEHLVQRGRSLGRGELPLQALHRLGEALVGDRLQEIVHHLAIEGLHRVLVERGHEHHVSARIDALGELDAGEAGHADVEERDFGLFLVDGA